MDQLKDILDKVKNLQGNCKTVADAVDFLMGSIQRLTESENSLKKLVEEWSKKYQDIQLSVKSAWSEFEKEKNKDKASIEAMKLEAQNMFTEATTHKVQAEKYLESAKNLEDSWNEKNIQVQKLKEELSLKHEKAKAYAASLG